MNLGSNTLFGITSKMDRSPDVVAAQLAAYFASIETRLAKLENQQRKEDDDDLIDFIMANEGCLLAALGKLISRKFPGRDYKREFNVRGLKELIEEHIPALAVYVNEQGAVYVGPSRALPPKP